MKVTNFFILCGLIIILSVQARPTQFDKKQLSFEDYLKRLTLLAHQNTNIDSDDSDSLSMSMEDSTPITKRGFLFFPDRRSTKRHYRPMYSYGRKSHWDTFFG
ncbi:hypothetical protein I4U23_028705 [Adineta vaga]|nr:hypothetical protein I4U23_028705 [Adineta vaga]